MSNLWQNKRVLVTGAGGFIGSHLVEALLNEGAIVRAFIRYTSRGDIGLLNFLPREMLSDVEIIAGDLRDAQATEQCVNNTEVVFHLGALISIPYSYIHPDEVVQTNILGTLNILQACRAAGTKRLICTSTSEVFGTARYAPIDEDHPLQGQSPYSASKIGADKLAESFYCAYGLPVVTVRPFNTYGPRQSARAVIPTIITQALYQDVVHLGNLNATRDFTYISDTVSGFLAAAEAPNSEGKSYNLGTGEEISIGSLARMVFQILGKQERIEIEAERLRPEKSEVMRLISDNAFAQRELGWRPEVSFEEGLRRTIQWIGAHHELYRIGKYEF